MGYIRLASGGRQPPVFDIGQGANATRSPEPSLTTGQGANAPPLARFRHRTGG